MTEMKMNVGVNKEEYTVYYGSIPEPKENKRKTLCYYCKESKNPIHHMDIEFGDIEKDYETVNDQKERDTVINEAKKMLLAKRSFCSDCMDKHLDAQKKD